MSEEKEQLLKIIRDLGITEDDKDQGVDYEAEYRKQTGKDFETGEYTVQ